MDKANKPNLIGAFSSGCFQKFTIVTLVAMLNFMSFTMLPSYALADQFECFDGNNCNNALSTSKACTQGKDDDYEIFHPDVPKSTTTVTVLSFHGGKIEAGTSKISKSLQEWYGWDRYDLNGHVTTKKCSSLKKGSNKNFHILHITATNFDDPDALALVGAHLKSVAIHGYGTNKNYSKGTICVGGANITEIKAFIDYVNKNKDEFEGYSLISVNAPLIPEDVCTKNPETACCGLEGTNKENIVNKNFSKKGGLQLELSPDIRNDLINDNKDFNSLRSVIYGAIKHAMKF